MRAAADVALIGAGPVGLFAAFERGMPGMARHAADALPEIGGQCTALYPENPVYDIPAHPRLTGDVFAPSTSGYNGSPAGRNARTISPMRTGSY